MQNKRDRNNQSKYNSKTEYLVKNTSEPPLENEKDIEGKDKLSKKDKIDFLIKTVGLGSIIVGFLVYQNTIQQQQKFEDNQKSRTLAEDKKYKREQIVADSFLKLKQIEVDSNLKFKQIEIQKALSNSINAINFQNKLILEKARIDNQINLFSETVSSLRTILTSKYNSQEYNSNKYKVLNEFYPKIKLQNGKTIITLLDTFQENLKFYEFGYQIKFYRDTLVDGWISIFALLHKNSFPLTKFDTTKIIFSNKHFVDDFSILKNQEETFDHFASYFSFIFPKIEEFIKQHQNNPNVKYLMQLKDKCLNFRSNILEYNAALQKLNQIQNSSAQDSVFCIFRSEDYYSNLILKYFTPSYSFKMLDDIDPFNDIHLYIEIIQNNLQELSDNILIEMSTQNPVLRGN